jgi:hypothetical protein
MQLRSLGLAAVVTAAVAMQSSTAHADGEHWTVFETRIPLMRQPRPQFGRMDWRLVSELRLAGRYNGIEQIYLRTGPLFWFTNWLFVGTHVAVFGTTQSMLPSGAFPLQTEVRWDLEPNFFGRLGPITFNFRNRIEYRWFNNAAARWRYRGQLRVNLAPKDWVVMPFVMDEPLFDLSVDGFYQNRAHVGVGVQVLSNVRVDVAYMNRVRYVAGSTDWAMDHAGWINIFVDIPTVPAAPALSAATATAAGNTSAPAPASDTPTPNNGAATPTVEPPATTPTTSPASPGSLDSPPVAPSSATAPPAR